jgi:hypothetical protein
MKPHTDIDYFPLKKFVQVNKLFSLRRQSDPHSKWLIPDLYSKGECKNMCFRKFEKNHEFFGDPYQRNLYKYMYLYI